MSTPNVHPHAKLAEFWATVMPEMRESLGIPVPDALERSVAIAEELFGTLPASFRVELDEEQPYWVVFRRLYETDTYFGERYKSTIGGPVLSPRMPAVMAEIVIEGLPPHHIFVARTA